MRITIGVKIFGIAVGLLILMAVVALLSMRMTRTVDDQLVLSTTTTFPPMSRSLRPISVRSKSWPILAGCSWPPPSARTIRRKLTTCGSGSRAPARRAMNRSPLRASTSTNKSPIPSTLTITSLWRGSMSGSGWGLVPGAQTFFQWGDNGRFKALAIDSSRNRSAIVILTNGRNGMSIMPELMQQFMLGDRPSLSWSDYSRYDANRQ